MAQGMDLQPHIQILNYELDVVHDFVHLGSNTSNSLSRSLHRAPEEDRWKPL